MHFWEKDAHWMQTRAVAQPLLRVAHSGRAWARLLWLMENLMYDDLLKGTGWGRKRSWFREQLEECNTVSQVLRRRPRKTALLDMDVPTLCLNVHDHDTHADAECPAHAGLPDLAAHCWYWRDS